jgi:NitT/TauT family transport system permease protein
MSVVTNKRILALQLVATVCTILIWEYVARSQLVNPMFIGQPSLIAAHLAENIGNGTLLRAIWVTLAETLAGFVAGMAVGALIGTALWWSRLAGRVVEPLIVVFNAVPKVALAPIFIVILGVGFSMKLALSFTNVVVLATLAAYSGARRVDPDLLDLIRSVGGGNWRIFRLVVLPVSLMWLVSVFEIGLGLAFVGAVT